MLAFLKFLCRLIGLCSDPKPPIPPDPTPEPPPTYDNNRVLRTLNGKLTLLDGTPFAFDQGVQCCDATPGVENSRWPLCSEAQMDFFKSYGLNALHFRLGPFYGGDGFETEWSDIGGGYVGGAYDPPTLVFNENFFAKVEELVQYAYDHNMWVEVCPIDTWYCKRASSIQGFRDQRMPWPQADIDAGGITMTPVQKTWLEAWVDRLGKFPNIIWLTDNEGGEIRGTKREWYEAVASIIRGRERAMGFPVHIIGTNNTDFASGPFDYVATHEKAALVAPIAGKWTLNNERNPEFPPGQEISNFANARRIGLSYAFWRAGMTDAAMYETLEGYKRVIEGSPLPSVCYAPDGEDPRWIVPPAEPENPPTNGTKKILAELAKAKQVVGSRCGQDPPTTLELIAKQLRTQGLCASKSSDAVLVKRDDGKYVELHVVAYTDGCYTQNPVKYIYTYTGAQPSPVVCPDPQPPELAKFNIKEHTKGPNWTVVDATPIVRGREYCASIGFTDGRSECPVRVEGDPSRVACEQQVVGTPVWSGVGESVPTNPYQRRVPRGVSGTVTIRGKNGVSASLEVTP